MSSRASMDSNPQQAAPEALAPPPPAPEPVMPVYTTAAATHTLHSAQAWMPTHEAGLDPSLQGVHSQASRSRRGSMQDGESASNGAPPLERGRASYDGERYEPPGGSHWIPASPTTPNATSEGNFYDSYQSPPPPIPTFDPTGVLGGGDAPTWMPTQSLAAPFNPADDVPLYSLSDGVEPKREQLPPVMSNPHENWHAPQKEQMRASQLEPDLQKASPSEDNVFVDSSPDHGMSDLRENGEGLEAGGMDGVGIATVPPVPQHVYENGSVELNSQAPLGRGDPSYDAILCQLESERNSMAAQVMDAHAQTCAVCSGKGVL